MSEDVVIYEQSDDGGWGAYVRRERLLDPLRRLGTGCSERNDPRKVGQARRTSMTADRSCPPRTTLLARSPRRSFSLVRLLPLRRRAAAG
jgi:hypothetical protein